MKATIIKKKKMGIFQMNISKEIYIQLKIKKSEENWFFENVYINYNNNIYLLIIKLNLFSNIIIFYLIFIMNNIIIIFFIKV